MTSPSFATPRFSPTFLEPGQINPNAEAHEWVRNLTGNPDLTNDEFDRVVYQMKRLALSPMQENALLDVIGQSLVVENSPSWESLTPDTPAFVAEPAKQVFFRAKLLALCAVGAFGKGFVTDQLAEERLDRNEGNESLIKEIFQQCATQALLGQEAVVGRIMRMFGIVTNLNGQPKAAVKDIEEIVF